MDKKTELDEKLEKAAELNKNLDSLFDHIRNPPKDERAEAFKASMQRYIDSGYTKSLYRQIDKRYDDIEYSLARGWSYEKMVKVLNLAGLEISLDTFRKYLYRMRKKRGVKPSPGWKWEKRWGQQNESD